MSEAKYDVNFICLSFGLIPINGGISAIAPGAIVDIKREDKSVDQPGWVLTLHGGQTHFLSHKSMAELEVTIKQRSEETKILQREAMKAQMLMQYEISQEIQNGVQRAAGIIGASNRRHS